MTRRRDYTHRYLCSVLEEMRDIIGKVSIWNYTRSISILALQVEEAQVHANRMEAALGYAKDIKALHEDRKKLQAEVDALNGLLPEKVDEDED